MTIPKFNKFTRREFFSFGGSYALALIAALDTQAVNRRSTKKLPLYVGTYTSNTKSQGIYVFEFDLETGSLALLHTVKNVADPSFLTIENSGRYLFAVNEIEEFEGNPGGSVSAFSINKRNGDLTFLNKQPSLGGAPCHITTSDNGKFALVANYVSGNVSVFPIAGDGRLGPSVSQVQHSGSGPNKDRQTAPHAHSITLDRRNQFAFAVDLGIDKVMIYRFDSKTGELKPNATQPYFNTKPGAGPRHFAFHPDGKLAFVINELDSSVTSLAYITDIGTLTEIHTISALSPDFKGINSGADIHVSPDGKYVYSSNRGEDSIAIFKIDPKNGKIKYVGKASSGGKKPRNFAIDPTGSFLLAANQETGNVVVYRIDRSTGKLIATDKKVEIAAPVCLRFGRSFMV